MRVDRAEVPEPSVTLPGLVEAVRPDRETKVESETVPVNPLRLDRVRLEVADELA